MHRLFYAIFALFAAVTATATAAEVPGYTEPYKTITVSSSEPGVIAEVLVEEGARVKKSSAREARYCTA